MQVPFVIRMIDCVAALSLMIRPYLQFWLTWLSCVYCTVRLISGATKLQIGIRSVVKPEVPLLCIILSIQVFWNLRPWPPTTKYWAYCQNPKYFHYFLVSARKNVKCPLRFNFCQILLGFACVCCGFCRAQSKFWANWCFLEHKCTVKFRKQNLIPFDF